MKRIVSSVVLAMMAAASFAGSLFVYSVSGKAEKKTPNGWVELTKRAELNESDVIRVAEGSSLSVLDRSAEKIYATGATSDKTVGTMIKDVQSSSSATQQFVSYAAKSLFSGGTDNISHSAAGCTYRGDIIESDIAKTILAKRTNEPQLNVDNAQTDFGITFDIVDRYTGQLVYAAQAGKEVYFRIKNTSSKMLYVNIIDVTSTGELAECLPIDDAQTLSHLLIPANSVIDLSDYPVELTLPVGTDNLLLVASEVPFDMRQVTRYLKMENIKPEAKQQIGVYSRSVAIMK